MKFKIQNQTQLIKELESFILSYHEEAYRNTTCLHEFSEILEVNESQSSLRLKNTKFLLLDWDSNSIGIPSTVSHEVLQHTFTWAKEENFLNLKEPFHLEPHADDSITWDLDWDNPDLPQEVIDNFEVDLLGLGEQLEDYYESIEKIDYDDIPKVLRPLVEKCVREYSKWKQEEKFKDKI